MVATSGQSLQGHGPDRGSTCLLIIDMINPFTFPEAGDLLQGATAAAERIAVLKRRVKQAGLPVVYVNDNFGKWQSDFRRLIAECLAESCRGQHIAELLHPEDDDYFVLKPKHSGFYATPLELLLRHLGVQRLILSGVAGNSCVLHTASDAYMREFALFVPADCTASARSQDNDAALDHMSRMLKADLRRSSDLSQLHFPRSPHQILR
jgi:nicotinamidase-related amidase